MDNVTFWGLLFGPIIMLSFLVTLMVLPQWIRRAKEEKLVGKDIHKYKKLLVAEGGGIAVLIGFIVSVMLYIAVRTFVFKDNTHLIEIFAMISTLFFAATVGVFDDLLGWKKGLSKRTRLILITFAAVPLMVINVGNPTVYGFDFGILYTLIFIPIGIVGATTTYNFLAGFNGLEASQGILVLLGLTIVNFIVGNWWLSLIGACMIASLCAFYLFNKYPARVFPGDIMTYTVGAMIASIAIIGNIEKIAIFFFIPYILEVILKSRGKFKIESFGKVNKDGSLNLRQKKICGLEHVAIYLLKKIKPSKKAYEWEIPLVINIFQIIVIVVGFLIFF